MAGPYCGDFTNSDQSGTYWDTGDTSYDKPIYSDTGSSSVWNRRLIFTEVVAGNFRWRCGIQSGGSSIQNTNNGSDPSSYPFGSYVSPGSSGTCTLGECPETSSESSLSSSSDSSLSSPSSNSSSLSSSSSSSSSSSLDSSSSLSSSSSGSSSSSESSSSSSSLDYSSSSSLSSSSLSSSSSYSSSSESSQSDEFYCCTTPACWSADATCSYYDNWTLSGATQNNTDNCKIYAKTVFFGSTQQVSFYSDSARTLLTAVGQRIGAGIITLTERNSSGVSATVSWDGTGNSSTLVLDCEGSSSSTESSSESSESEGGVSESSSSSSSSEGCYCDSWECVEGTDCIHFGNWAFTGVNFNNSTNCRLFILLDVVTPTYQQVSVYKEVGHTTLVAIGQSNNATITLSEFNSSGVSGSVTWDLTEVEATSALVVECSAYASSSSSSSLEHSSSSSESSSSSSSSSSVEYSSSSSSSSNSSSSSSSNSSSSSSNSSSSSSSLSSPSSSSSSFGYSSSSSSNSSASSPSSESSSSSSESSSSSSSNSSSSSVEHSSSSSSSSSSSFGYTSSSSESQLVIPNGWTWGYATPPDTTAVGWNVWKYYESSTEARNTGVWGDLEVKNYEKFVSGVMDSRTIKPKLLTITPDEFGTGEGSGTMQYRVSDSLFAQSSDQITGPVWIDYTDPIQVTERYIQILVRVN